MIRSALTAIFAAALVAPLASAAPTAIGRYKDWTVFTEKVNGETLCYAATEATDKAPKSADHGDIWFFVSNWKSGKARSLRGFQTPKFPPIGSQPHVILPAGVRVFASPGVGFDLRVD